VADGYSASEADGARLIWILDLTYAGEVLRLASEPVDVTIDGVETQYTAALSGVEWDGVVGSADAARGVSLKIVMPPGYSWGARVAAGHLLPMALGELSLIREGDLHSARVRLLSGGLDAPEYGADGEPMRCSLVSSASEDRGAILPGGAVVSVATWLLAVSMARGRAYPLVFGQPKPTASVMPCTPGLVVDSTARTLLIAGHRVGAATVWIVDRADPGNRWTSLSVTHMDDPRGREVATVQLPSTGDGAYQADGRYYVSWSVNGGWAKEHYSGGRPLTGAGDVLEWALGLTTMDVDRGRVAAVVDRLNAFILAGYVDDLEASAWDWIRAQLLPILPIEIQRGPDGAYPVCLPYGATAGDALVALDAARDGLHRVSPVEWARTADGAVSEIRIRYALDEDTGEYSRTLVVHGDPSLGTATDLELNYHLCRARIMSPYSAPAVYTVQTDIVYDETTASRIGRWIAASRGVPARTVMYAAPVRYAWLQPGDVVTITDDAPYLTEQVCIVRAVRITGGPAVVISLETVEGAR